MQTPSGGATIRQPFGQELLVRAAHRAGRGIGRIDVLTARVRPWMVLGPLVVLGWLVAGFVGRVAVHTGWLYYSGGDDAWYYTSAWVLGHGQLPPTEIGYGYPMLLAPLARIAGPNLLAGLPLIVVFNVVVLGPIALLCVYGIAKGIAGRRFAYVVSAIWVVAPLLAIPYFLPDYHRRYVGLSLPADLGLTVLGDFPSMVALLVAAYFLFRSIARRDDGDALVAGLAIGLAIAVKPANAIFLPAPFLALVAARRARALTLCGAGILPALVCLIAWKYRGLGDLPLFAAPTHALASGTSSPPVATTVHLGRYLPLHWGRLMNNLDGFREFTWSRRLMEWTFVAGAIGLCRRSLPAGLLFAGWLASFFLIKGSSVADFYGGSFFRYMAPAFPAAFLLAMSIPLLLPIAGRRLAAAGDFSTWPGSLRARRGVLAAGLVLSIAPIIPILALPQQSTPIAVQFSQYSILVPSDQFTVSAVTSGHTVALSWAAQRSHGSRVRYEVFRTRQDGLECNRPANGSLSCDYPITPTETVTRTSWHDRPPSGHWVYRVAVVAGVPPPIGAGSEILLSRQTAVDLR